MKKRILSLVLALTLALGLCAATSAAEAGSAADGAISVRGLGDGQRAFVAGYDEAGQFLGARVLTADGDAQPIPGAAEVKVVRTDGQLAPLGEAVSLSRDFQVRKVDGRVELCYEGPDGVSVTQPVTRKITGKVASFNTIGELRINSTPYTATELTVQGCEYTVTREGFESWERLQPGKPLGDTLDFYLDPWGNVCWIDLVAEYVYPINIRLILSAEVVGTFDGGAIVRAELLFSSGWVETVTVSNLDGRPVTDPDAAVAQLSAHAPGGFYACQRQHDGTYSMTATENTPDSGWGETLTIPTDTVTAPAADFTQGKVNCLADTDTLFVVSWGQPDAETVTHSVEYRYWDLPAVTVFDGTVIIAEGDPAATPVARFVYLRTLDPKPTSPAEPPDGYVFLAGNSWRLDPELAEDEVCLVPIVDTDGANADMRIPAQLKEDILNDSMEIGKFPDNAYLGKFCAVTEIDENRTVSALEPATASDVTALENGVITTAAGSWAYDEHTVCVCVDLSWTDDLYDMTNTPGVREDTDFYYVSGSGRVYDPDSFFVPGDVSLDPADGTFYRSARAAVIPAADDPAVAAYIYIVREVW